MDYESPAYVLIFVFAAIVLIAMGVAMTTALFTIILAFIALAIVQEIKTVKKTGDIDRLVIPLFFSVIMLFIIDVYFRGTLVVFPDMTLIVALEVIGVAVLLQRSKWNRTETMISGA